MLESGIVAHCAPTLAGIKTANMFNYLPDDMEDLPREVQEENRKPGNGLLSSQTSGPLFSV